MPKTNSLFCLEDMDDMDDMDEQGIPHQVGSANLALMRRFPCRRGVVVVTSGSGSVLLVEVDGISAAV